MVGSWSSGACSGVRYSPIHEEAGAIGINYSNVSTALPGGLVCYIAMAQVPVV